MSGGGSPVSAGHVDSPWIGVVASPLRVEAQVVEETSFGRLRALGRRVSEDVDGAGGFVPLPMVRQLKAPSAGPDELRAGQAWVETIANAVAKVSFGLRGTRLRLGVALHARLDGAGRDVVCTRGGARVPRFSEALEQALLGRNIAAAPVHAVVHAEAWTRGELRSALGKLAAGPNAVVLVWDEEVSWVDVVGGRVATVRTELEAGRLDLGLAGIDQERRRRQEPRPVFVAARDGDERAAGLLRAAATALGLAAATWLLDRPSEAPHARRGEPWRAGAPSHLVVGGRVGRLFDDPRLAPLLRRPFEAGLARGLHEREDAAMLAGLLHRDDSEAALVHVSAEGSAALLGAADAAQHGRDGGEA